MASLLYFTFVACHSSKLPMKDEQRMNQQITNAPVRGGNGNAVSSPTVLVYKTKADYTHLVPIIMNETRTCIVSYPHPLDLITGGRLCLPTSLADGYLLDNRGIGSNVVFLSYTYEAYSQLSSPPSMQDMLARVVDKYPLVEMYDCGRRMDYLELIPELNKLIEKGFLNCILLVKQSVIRL